MRSTQDTRRWAFYSLGAQMCAQDTGRVHGPREADRWRWCIAPAVAPGGLPAVPASSATTVTSLVLENSELRALLDRAVRDWSAFDGRADDFGRKHWVATAQDKYGLGR